MYRVQQLVAIAAVLTIGSGACAAPDDPQAEAQLVYGGNGAIDGAVHGVVQALEIRPKSGHPDQVSVRNASARLVLVHTEVNYTILAGEHAVEEGLRPLQRIEEIPIGGNLRIAWPSSGPDRLGVLYGSGWLDGNIHSFPLEIETDAMHWSNLQQTADREDYWYANEGPQYRYGGFAADHRVFELPRVETVRSFEPAVLHVREAVIETDHNRFAMPQHVRVRDDITSPFDAVRRSTVLITDGFLVIDSGAIHIQGHGFEAAAAESALSIAGDLSIHDATGRYRVLDSSGSFAHESMVFSGIFDWTETLASRPDQRQGSVSGTARGDIAVIAVDYVVAASAPSGPSLIEQAMWVTIALTLAGALAWSLQHGFAALYSRIKQDAVLDHPKRADIMSFIEQNPGCHVLGLAEALGLARGVARHHLMILERAGKLRRFQASGQSLLAPAHQSKEDALRAAAAEDPRIRTILWAVQQEEMRRVELVALLRDLHGVADPTARRWITKAVRAGLIRESGSGHRVTYRGAS